ncbi:hypothetical protein INP57_18175 [Saccharopolyspora sp. HNM0986]|uniref:hypothetical protein n=1 Tax=Saccharopolyspora galaxeae TaxID=2781241 RepID=UPI00190B208B|nr:hypothetical protein [Saccharopolyspora sp. HNM0986]MBK0868742.1 hypothetical protein [Saccharopolyspora sp. HNM0986]
MPASIHTTTLAHPRPATCGAVLAQLARDRPSRVVFATLTVITFAVYATVLPSEQAGGQLSLSNWTYLTGLLLGFAIVLALGLAAVLTVQVYALRQAVAARCTAGGRAALGGLGFLASLVPSLCCSPVLPAVLALFGVGASGATATMKTIAPYATVILTATLGFFLLHGWWSIRRLARQGSATAGVGEDCCGPAESTGR